VDWKKTISTPDTNPFQIGVYGWRNDYIDDMQVYDHALSDAEVAGMVGIAQP